MQYQIDFLPVGEKRCGEAIAIRFGDLESDDLTKQYIVLIDGGYSSDDERIINYLKEHYGTDYIDLMVSTHPDIDHIGGLPGVVEKARVANLWMHLPWEHSADYLEARQSEFVNASVAKKLKKALSSSNDLALAADAKSLVPVEPFAGTQFPTPYGTVTVLSPTVQHYENLIDQILGGKTASSLQKSTLPSLEAALQQLAASQSVMESHHHETLSDKLDTTPSNNTSAVILIELNDGHKFLFCGDAGKSTLEIAYAAYELLGHKTGELHLVQVPHHGSRRNVGPTILDKFLGEKTAKVGAKVGNAVVSVGKVCNVDGHPKKVVTNAFKRRGYPVTQTRGKAKMFGMDRPGWSPVPALPLFTQVEAE